MKWLLIIALALSSVPADAAGLWRHRGASYVASFFVATTGNDSNPGTQASPFLTLGAAQTAMRASVSTKAATLRGGTYILTAPLALTSADNSETWQSYPGENAIISGGNVLTTGWTLHDTPNNIWQLTGITWNFRELYVNNLHATRARNTVTTSVPNTGNGWSQTATTVTAPSSVYAAYGNKPSIELVSVGRYGMARCLASSIAGAVFTMQAPCQANLFNWNATYAGPPYNFPGEVQTLPNWVENAYELLAGCGAGCWYLDTTAQILYYIPRGGETMNTVPIVAPRYVHLVTGSGVDGLMFSRLTFAHNAYLDPSSAAGYTTMQSGYRCTHTAPADGCPNFGTDITYVPLDSPIRFSGASKNIVFDHNLFTHLGGRPVFFEHGSQNGKFTANKFTDNSGGGSVQWGDITDYAQTTPTLQTSNLTFINNYVTGPFEYETPLLFQVYSTGGTISYNEMVGSVGDLSYSSISAGWGWGPGFSGVASYEGGYSITNNYIHDYMPVLPDGGGIYTQGVSTPFTVSNNYVKHNLSSPLTSAAYYLDESTSNSTWTNNVADTAGSGGYRFTAWAINQFDNVGNFIINNYTDVAGIHGTGTGTISPNTTVTSPITTPPAAVTIINNAGIQAGVTPGP